MNYLEMEKAIMEEHVLVLFSNDNIFIFTSFFFFKFMTL
jgi:hypothetical protein